jgi:hypothetical protein
MYCEIIVKHRKRIDAAGLTGAIQAPFGNPVSVVDAYRRNAIYRGLVPPLAPLGAPPPPPSLFAFDTVLNCFVVVRKVNVLLSTYHLEGNSSVVSVETLLQAAREFSSQLMRVLGDTPQGSAYGVRSLTVVLFEDNGRETGMQGELVTLGSVFGEEFSWKELKSSVIPFATALLLIWRGLKQEPIRASIYSLVIGIAFTLTQVGVRYWRGRGKIKWKLGQN